MATTMAARLDKVPLQTFNQQKTETKDATESAASTQLVVKGEKLQRMSCPYSSDRSQKEESSINGEHAKKPSPPPPLSPEFLLGSSEQVEQEQTKTKTKGPTEVEKSIACVYCNETFPTKSAREQHFATKHEGKKLYDCSVCEKRFTHRSSRDIHLRVHTGQRPYECEFCKKRFRVSSHLRDHVRTHTGERPFKCSVCGRGFKQSSDMKKHRKTHFKGVPPGTSYMIVRPEEATTATEDGPSDLRSPTDQRQNLKLVIKRERKPTEVRKPSDNSTKTVSGNNTQLVSNMLPVNNNVPGNNTFSGKKPSEDRTQYAGEKNIEANTIWPPNTHHVPLPAIRSAQDNYLPKHSPGKVTVKRKVDRNSCKPMYPSMASEFGQVYTSTGRVALQRQDLNLTSTEQQFESRLPYENQTKKHEHTLEQQMANGSSQEQQIQFENRLPYAKQAVNSNGEQTESTFLNENQTRKAHDEQKQLCNNQASNIQQHHQQHGLPYENRTVNFQKRQAQFENSQFEDDNATSMESQDDNAFWQPETKIIKSEKLSPNSRAEPTHCRVQPTISHVHTMNDHAQASLNHVQMTAIHDLPTYTYEQSMARHEQPTADHELHTQVYEPPQQNHDLTSYTHERRTESENTTMHVDEVHAYNGDATMADDEEVTNQNPSPHITSVNSVSMQQAEASTYTETPALANTSAEIPEVSTDVLPESQVASGKVTSESTVRRQMVVKLKRDKTGGKNNASFSVQTSKEQEDAHCKFGDENYNSQSGHKCAKNTKNAKIFKCTICSKVFARGTLLRQHMVLHQGSKRFRFKCNYCGRAFRHRSHLRDHERIHTGERPFKCSFCPKAFKQSSDHRKHENLHTGTTRYRCEKCSLDFKRCDALKRHAMMHTKGEVTLLKCEKCRSLFATADGHMSHVCLNKPYRYRCQICPERFTDADDLRRHCYENHGEQSTESCLKCEFCKLEFNNLEELDKHLGTHRLEKTHTCRTCNQKFSLLNQLVEHVKTHSGHHPPKLGTDDPVVITPLPVHKTTQKQDHSQHMENPSNQTPRTSMPQSPHKSRQRYDFIPSRYQSLLHTNSMYGDLAVGNWARSRNLYLPIQPKHSDDGRSQDEIAPVTSRDNPTGSQSTSKYYSTTLRSNTEPYQSNAETSELDPTSYKPVTSSSESGSISNSAYPQTSPAADLSSPAFTAFHAIASSKSALHRKLTRKNRHEPTVSRRELPEPDVVTKGGRVYFPDAANPLLRNNSNTSNDKTRINPEIIRRNSETSEIYADKIRRNSEEVRINSERNQRCSESDRVSPIQRNPTNGRENTVISEDHIADRRANQKVDFAQKPIAKRKYTCLNCRLEFYHESSLVDHVCDILSETLYRCLVCEADFVKYEDLQQHMRTHWKPVVYYKCTLCGYQVKSEELLKEHNLKHLEDVRAERGSKSPGHDPGDKDGYRRMDGKAGEDANDPCETYVSPPGSAKSVTSPVICSVTGNVVISGFASERDHKERSIELANQSAARDDVVPRSSSYIPYYEARKRLNVFGQDIVVSAMHATIESSGRYPLPNGLIYPPTMPRTGYTVDNHQ